MLHINEYLVFFFRIYIYILFFFKENFYSMLKVCKLNN